MKAVNRAECPVEARFSRGVDGGGGAGDRGEVGSRRSGTLLEPLILPAQAGPDLRRHRQAVRGVGHDRVPDRQVWDRAPQAQAQATERSDLPAVEVAKPVLSRAQIRRRDAKIAHLWLEGVTEAVLAVRFGMTEAAVGELLRSVLLDSGL